MNGKVPPYKYCMPGETYCYYYKKNVTIKRTIFMYLLSKGIYSKAYKHDDIYLDNKGMGLY